jgi:hypothetical protein
MTMRNFQTVVLERMSWVTGRFQTEPYECGWASEAIFVVRVHEIEGSIDLRSTVQLSVDGIQWMDDDLCFPRIDRAGSFFLRVRHFGGWLRLASDLGSTDARARLTIYLVLKE